MDGLWLQLLGPVVARCDGQVMKLGGPKARAVLSAMAIRVNRVLSTDQLVAMVWGREASVSRDNVYHCVSALKAALAPARNLVVLEGLRPNYRLVLDQPERVIDWHRFCTLTSEAATARDTGEPDRALALYRHALGLWQGEPLADIGDALSEFRHAMTARRLGAAEELAQLELRHGEPAYVVDLLEELCAQHPERERAAALLVRALAALGRRDEATLAYQRTRRYVVNSLGLDPSRLLEEAYRSLTNDPVPAASQLVLRAGLRRLDGHFVGRSAELEHVCNVLSGGTSGTASSQAVVCTIDGMPGTGKSQLALRAAHAVADRFPDGPLYIDLLGYQPNAQPLDPADALGQLLQKLGVPAEQIPPDIDHRATVYRAALAGSRRLILLDNAMSTSQVQPLLPAEPACGVIITSRKRLTALDDAHAIRLGVLEPAPASELFAAVAGLPGESDQDAAAIAKVVDGCGRLPLAIRILAARYRDHSWSSLSELESHLADEHDRLRLLDDGERSITVAFTLSYQSLPEDQRRMFRLLGLIPGPEPLIDAYDAAALAAVSLSAAQHLLARLAANGLLSQPVPGRYAFHDLLRAYASQLVMEEPEANQREGFARLSSHYCYIASLAMNLYAPYEAHRRPRMPVFVTPPPPLRTREHAQAWLDDHQRTLVSVAQQAAANGIPSHATHLTQTLFRYLDIRMYDTEVVTLYTVVLQAARLTGDRSAEAHLLNDLAGVHSRYGRNELALEYLQHALSIDRETGNRAGEARTLGNLASAYGRLENYDEAIDHHRLALDLYVELGDRVSETRGITNLSALYVGLGRYDNALELLQSAHQEEYEDRAGRGSALAIFANAYWGLGRHEDAVHYHEQALALLREVGDLFEEAETLNDFGRTLRELGRYDEARASHTEALSLANRTYNRTEQARAHDGLAHINYALGLQHQAVGYWSQALRIFSELKSTMANDVRDHLASLGLSREELYRSPENSR